MTTAAAGPYGKLQSSIAANTTPALYALLRATAADRRPNAALVAVAINCELRKRNGGVAL